MCESMSRDLVPLSLSFLAMVIDLGLVSLVGPVASGEDAEPPVADAGFDWTVALGQMAAFYG